MALQPIEFNEALVALAERQRSGALSQAEFRQQRRQLLALLMVPAERGVASPPDVVAAPADRPADRSTERPPAAAPAATPAVAAPSRKLLVMAALLALALLLVLVLAAS